MRHTCTDPHRCPRTHRDRNATRSVGIAASWAGAGADEDEHPPSANSPGPAIAKIARFAICAALAPEFRLTIERPPIGVSYVLRGAVGDAKLSGLFRLSFHRRNPRCKFRLERFEVETRALLHRRVSDKGLRFFSDFLLPETKRQNSWM